MLFQRNNNNMCAVASYAMYPTVAQASSVTTTTPKTASVQTTVKPTLAPTSTVPLTTVKPVTTTTIKETAALTTSSSQTKPVCYNGTGVYPNSGCQSYYNCSLTLVQYYCPSGYLFDFNTQSCRITSQVVCNPSPYYCPNGVGKYYPKAGCQNVYYCKSQVIQTYTCPTGQSYNPSTRACATTGSFTCTI